MKKNEIPVVILKTRTGYSAHSPIIDGCIVTGKTIDKTLVAFKEAVIFHLEGAKILKRKFRNPLAVMKKSLSDYGTGAIYATVVVAA